MVRWTESAGQVTESVGLRLIHMMKEDPGMFAEFQALVGPDGLDLVKRTQLASISSAQVVGQGGSTKAVPQESFYYPAFEPSGTYGGAWLIVPFFSIIRWLSSAIRIVTALLFDKWSLMLMEQPEDSIHPGLLRKLIDVLRSYSSNSQIVFTTHSPDVLDVLEPNEVLLVVAPDGYTTADHLSPDEVLNANRFLKNEGLVRVPRTVGCIKVMWAVLAEDWSDVDAIVVLLKRISGIDNQKIFRKGFNGCGALRTKACRIMGEFSTKGATRFIICHDSDGVDVREIKAKFVATLNDPRCAGLDHQVIVPVQELEAWIIADEGAIKKAIPSLSIRKCVSTRVIGEPEGVVGQRIAEGCSKPLFVPSLHNKLVASFIDLAKLERKCPSFLASGSL